MLVRASIEPLSWENTFFGVNSAIVRFDQRAPVLTADALLPGRVYKQKYLPQIAMN